MMEGKKIGRPPLAAPARLFRLTLSLRPGEDDDLIAFFEELPTGSRARAVVTALRQGGVGERRGLQQEIDEAELTAMLEELLF